MIGAVSNLGYATIQRVQRLGNMGADEAGGSCYQDRHPQTSVYSLSRAIWTSGLGGAGAAQS